MNEENTTPSAGGDPLGSEGGKGRFDRAKDAAGEKFSAASEAMKNRYGAMKDRVGEVDFAGMTDNVRTYVRGNPGKALLISIGVGFLVGLLLRRDRDDD